MAEELSQYIMPGSLSENPLQLFLLILETDMGLFLLAFIAGPTIILQITIFIFPLMIQKFRVPSMIHHYAHTSHYALSFVFWASLIAQLVENLPAMQETPV